MKRVFLTALAASLLSVPAFAQDSIGYIPGIPVPQSSPPLPLTPRLRPLLLTAELLKLQKFQKLVTPISAPFNQMIIPLNSTRA